MYRYSGQRTKEDLVQFATGKYSTVQGTPIPGKLFLYIRLACFVLNFDRMLLYVVFTAQPTFFDEIRNTVTSLLKGAQVDFNAGKYTSPRIMVLALPIVFVVVLAAIIITTPSDSGIPAPEEDEGAEETKGDKKKND